MLQSLAKCIGTLIYDDLNMNSLGFVGALKPQNDVWDPVPEEWPSPKPEDPIVMPDFTASTGRGGSGAVPKEKLGWKTLRLVFRCKLCITVVKFFTMDMRSELK